MKLATAYFILISVLFIYGNTIKQPDHRNVRKPASARHIVKTSRELARTSEIAQVQSFLSGTPLEGEAQTFVDASFAYGLDYRLLPAISGTESTFGKFPPSCAPYNPFGYSSSVSPCGFHRFTSYNEAIWTVAQTLALNRAYAGFRQAGEVSVLASEYNPSGLQEWANSTNYFIARIK